jgi:signal transduction histidine kinase
MGVTALRVPLALKLLGAHLLGLAIVGAVLYTLPASARSPATVMLATLAAVVVFGLLASVALLPLRGIEAVATRVWRGDFGARVGASPVADRDMKRIGTTFNLLLDGLVADRARMRTLASSVIDAGDRERAMLARELHDSTAQQLAALVLQLSAAARDCSDASMAERLQRMRDQASEALEEVRLLSHTVHPRVLDDLGLPAALRNLGRESADVGKIEIDVAIDDDGEAIPPTLASALYRVAQAAVHNVVKHAEARHVDVQLTVRDGEAVLDVIDDGQGFDVAEAEQRRPGMGLFTMRERVALAGGRFDIRSVPGSGTHVSAAVPLTDRLHGENRGVANE